MSRHLVCLSFDFDALSGWIARGLTTPTPMSRGEFGAIGAKRILTLLAKHNVRSPGSFQALPLIPTPTFAGE